MKERKEYLGDSVYVTIMEDGLLRLCLNNGYEDTNIIYLEPEVSNALYKLIKELKEVI